MSVDHNHSPYGMFRTLRVEFKVQTVQYKLDKYTTLHHPICIYFKLL